MAFHNKIPHSSVRPISLDFVEAIFVTIKDRQSDLSIGSIYCSPSATRTQSKSFFAQILSTPGRVVIAGDFNAKHRSWNSNKNCRKGSDPLNLCTSRRFQIHPPDGPTLVPPRGLSSTFDFALSKAMVGISDPLTVNALIRSVPNSLHDSISVATS